MKTSTAILFFSILILILSLLNWYILRRVTQASQGIKWLSVIVVVIVVIGNISFLTGMIFEKSKFQLLISVLKWIGSYWLAYMLYTILFLVALDIVRILISVTGAASGIVANNIAFIRLLLLFVVFLYSTTLIFVGRRNAVNTRVKTISIDIPRKKSELNELNVMYASDIHLGSIIHKKDVQRIVDIADDYDPDLILFGGDILDSDVQPAIRYNSGEPLKKLHPQFGVYAVTGNHEYISRDIDKAAGYIESLNIYLLRDSVADVNGCFNIAGREDRDMTTFTGKERLPLPELLSKANKDLPLILMDHQPFNLDQSSELGVDLHLSGHTHNGQLWPLNLLTDAIFEKSWGYLKKGATHFYVSCGFGVWGPKVRLGSYSEIVMINIKFIDNYEDEEPK